MNHDRVMLLIDADNVSVDIIEQAVALLLRLAQLVDPLPEWLPARVEHTLVDLLHDLATDPDLSAGPAEAGALVTSCRQLTALVSDQQSVTIDRGRAIDAFTNEHLDKAPADLVDADRASLEAFLIDHQRDTEDAFCALERSCRAN